MAEPQYRGDGVARRAPRAGLWLLLSLAIHGAVFAVLWGIYALRPRPEAGEHGTQVVMTFVSEPPLRDVRDAPAPDEPSPAAPDVPEEPLTTPVLPDAPPPELTLPPDVDMDLVPELEVTEIRPQPIFPSLDAVRRPEPVPAPAPRPAPAPPTAPPTRPAPSVGPPRAERLVPIHRPVHYPAEAQRLRLAGRVRVEALIDARGNVVRVALATSSGHAVLDRAALASARQWRFRPPGRYRRAYLPLRYVPD
jgi:protein TonB